MKNKVVLLVFCFSCSVFLYGQEEQKETVVTSAQNTKNTALSIGAFMGGGSLIGADFEFLIPKMRLGLQVGAGISSVGAGINYHLKDNINSSFISLQYFYQQFGDNHFASWLGPMYIYRAKKLFQAGIGVGSLVEKGPKWYTQKEKAQKVSASLIFNVGVYF
ncbi:MAG: hypothetical protein LBG15_09585 [Dysgonamonadaceae bacterium]|jgi:hypothetical protein|nr:hypothetical protein [Dysgonamonadaceae bacterium]